MLDLIYLASACREAEIETLSDLIKLERKAQDGRASRHELRTILLLRTQLGLLPAYEWWRAEV